MRTPHVLGIVLAGGQGSRLWPLTAERAKPAVNFGGGYRLIDFALSNLVNGGIHQIHVLTQYKSHSLHCHVTSAWALPGALGQQIMLVPAQQRLGPQWYAGSADAIFQSWHLVDSAVPDYVAVFCADQVYRMDPAQLLADHITSGAGVTVAGVRVPRVEATAFGCIDARPDGRITRFLEKPADPPCLPDDVSATLASTGNYIFTTAVLAEALRGGRGSPVQDVGRDVIPALADRGLARVYDLARNQVDGATEHDRGYWRDIGTLDSYYQANLDLVAEEPRFSLYNRQWPIRTGASDLPPVRFAAGGWADASILGVGCIIRGGSVTRSVLGPDVVVNRGAVVDSSVLLPGVRVGENAVIRGAIVDKNCVIGDGAQVGVDRADDRARYVTSPAGIVVIPKGTHAHAARRLTASRDVLRK